MDLALILSLLRRRAALVAASVALFSLLGVLAASLMPVTYIAQARLLVEGEQIPDEMAVSTVKTSATEQVQIITQRVLARDALVEMARKLEVYGSDSAEISANADKIVEDLRARITIEILPQPVQTGAKRNEPQANIVAVAFSAAQPSLASGVANELVTRILREDVMRRTGEARQTLEFFQQEVQRLDAELKQISDAILAFKTGNSEALPDALDQRRERLVTLEARLVQARAEEEDLRSKLNTLERRHAAADLADPSRVKATPPEQRKLEELESSYLALIRSLPRDDPKAQAMRAEIEDLRGALAGQPISAYDQRRREMLDQIETTAQIRAEAERELAALRALIAATPANSVTLDALERDYANIRAQYDTAVANRAMAETGDTIESLSRGQRITVIEPAVTPTKPAKPNRRVIAALGLVLGLALGVGGTLAEALLRPSLRRPEDLVAGLGIAPFATIPYLTTAVEAYEERRQLKLWGLGLAALIGLILLAIATLFAAPEVAMLQNPLDKAIG